jgi:hypothetical protein
MFTPIGRGRGWPSFVRTGIANVVFRDDGTFTNRKVRFILKRLRDKTGLIFTKHRHSMYFSLKILLGNVGRQFMMMKFVYRR